MKEICSSNHTYKFEHKLKPHLWEKKYEQEVIANEVIDATTEGEKFEEAFYANIAKGTFLTPVFLQFYEGLKGVKGHHKEV